MTTCKFCPLLGSAPDCLSYDLIVDAVLQVVSFVDAKCDSVLLKSSEVLKLVSSDEQQHLNSSTDVNSSPSTIKVMNEEFSRSYMTEILVSALFREKLQESIERINLLKKCKENFKSYTSSAIIPPPLTNDSIKNHLMDVEDHDDDDDDDVSLDEESLLNDDLLLPPPRLFSLDSLGTDDDNNLGKVSQVMSLAPSLALSDFEFDDAEERAYLDSIRAMTPTSGSGSLPPLALSNSIVEAAVDDGSFQAKGVVLKSQSDSSLVPTAFVTINDDDEKPYLCDLCPKRCPSERSLRDHRKTHLMERPHACDICGKRFFRKSGLDSHHYTHTGERPYKCKVCGKAFARKGSLTRHKMSHTDVKPFCCLKCGKRFRQKRSLKLHLLAHSKQVSSANTDETNN